MHSSGEVGEQLLHSASSDLSVSAKSWGLLFSSFRLDTWIVPIFFLLPYVIFPPLPTGSLALLGKQLFFYSLTNYVKHLPSLRNRKDKLEGWAWALLLWVAVLVIGHCSQETMVSKWFFRQPVFFFLLQVVWG